MNRGRTKNRAGLRDRHQGKGKETDYKEVKPVVYRSKLVNILILKIHMYKGRA